MKIQGLHSKLLKNIHTGKVNEEEMTKEILEQTGLLPRLPKADAGVQMEVEKPQVSTQAIDA
jgi:HD-like signal output (HDOD) protein